MRKFLLAAAILTVAAISANAQYRESENIWQRLIWDDEMLSILLDMRVDGQFSTGNDDGKELGFKGQTFKVLAVGEIIPGIRYRVRHRLNRSGETMRDSFTSATDHAWIAIDLGARKQWTLTVGKQSAEFGTFEYDYNQADIYLGTMCFNDLDTYKTGINATYRLKEQTLHFQVINSDEPQFASHEYRNKSLGFNFMWEGKLFDGVVNTRCGYSIFMHDKSKYYNWITPGIQININKFTSEIDYYYGQRNMDYGSMVDNENIGLKYVRDQSLAINLKYNFGKWRPSVKGTWNQRYDKNIGNTAYQSFGAQAAIEFYPFEHKRVKDLRFHASYYYNDTSFKGIYSNLSNKDSHTALFGLRWLFKAK